MVLREDQTVNRMHEALNIFKQTVNHEYLNDTPIILFLNKIDLLKDKISQADIKKCFPTFEGKLIL